MRKKIRRLEEREEAQKHGRCRNTKVRGKGRGQKTWTKQVEEENMMDRGEERVEEERRPKNMDEAG